MKRTRYKSAEFDHFVKALIDRWEFALELEPQWDSLDDEERIAHTEDWPVNNAIMMRLGEYFASHELTEAQKAQWARLNDIIARHTKTLEAMGYRVLPPKEHGERAVA
ncbi:MAG: hypothetical protein HY675_09310 [Chloroflexi bacterium]|nr:hypothetical protein [Chloroflexota bacterium]